MRSQLVPFAALAAACTGGGGAHTGATDTGPVECDQFYEGPTTIERVSVDCDDHQVTFRADTTGWSDGGWVFSQETGNVEPQWSEEHDLESVSWDDCGAWDQLERTVEDGSTLDDPLQDWKRDRSSVFECGVHYGDPRVMTYAFAVTDTDGELASCAVFGDDPRGLVNGSYDRVNEPSFDTSRCVTGVEAF